MVLVNVGIIRCSPIVSYRESAKSIGILSALARRLAQDREYKFALTLMVNKTTNNGLLLVIPALTLHCFKQLRGQATGPCRI